MVRLIDDLSKLGDIRARELDMRAKEAADKQRQAEEAEETRRAGWQASKSEEIFTRELAAGCGLDIATAGELLAPLAVLGAARLQAEPVA